MTTPSSYTQPGAAGQGHQQLSSTPISTGLPENDSNFGTIGHHENSNPVGQPTIVMHIGASFGTSIQDAAFLDSNPSPYAPIDYNAPFDSIPNPIPDPMLYNDDNGIDTLTYTMPPSYLPRDTNTLTGTSFSNPYSAQFDLSNIDNSMLASITPCPQTGSIPTTASGNNDNGIIAPTGVILYQPSHQFENTSWPTRHQTALVESLDSSHVATPATFIHLDLPPSSTAQPTALLPGGLLHQSAATTPPLNLPGAPQDSRQNELINQGQALSTSKRTADNQSPRRPEKRACPIRPKLTPAHPGPAANTLETNSGSRQSRAVKGKHGGIPANMMHTFQKEGLETLDASAPNTRSKKVCLRCQTLREKVSFFVFFSIPCILVPLQ